MFNFIGIGAALNPALGNNGVFMKSEDNKTLFMIDCGESTYARLIELDLLDGVEDIHVLMTHYHPDHSGSLATLVFHSFFKLAPAFTPKITIYTTQPNELFNLFIVVGVNPEMFKCVKINNEIENRGDVDEWGEVCKTTEYTFGTFGEFLLTPIRVPHSEIITTHSYIIYHNNSVIYYSADCKSVPPMVLDFLSRDIIHTMYQDVSTHDYEDSIHLSISKLDKLIPNDLKIRSKIFCMHLDDSWTDNLATDIGFNVVKRYEDKSLTNGL